MTNRVIAGVFAVAASGMAGIAFGGIAPGTLAFGPFPPIDIFEGPAAAPEFSITPLPAPVLGPGNVILLDSLIMPPDPFQQRQLWSDVLVFHPNAIEALFYSDVEGQVFDIAILAPGPIVFYLELTDPVVHHTPTVDYYLHSDPVPAPGAGAVGLIGAGMLLRRRRHA